MSSGPARVVIGIPVYNGGEPFAEALESLLTQTYRDVRFVLVDDRSDDPTTAIASRYAARDDRVSFHRNTRRLGLTSNWRRAFELATGLYPEAQFFAWGSDHDVWHPRWLETLVHRLDMRPDAAMAYTRHAILEPGRTLGSRGGASLDTSGTATAAARLWTMSRRMRGGQMIYGLFRVDAVRRAGGFRDVMVADRLLLTEVALQGQLVEVPEALWYRRPTSSFSIDRQRRTCFPHGAPLHTRAPWWLVHSASLAWTIGAGRAENRVAPRRAAPLVAGTALVANASQAMSSRARRRAPRG